MLSAIPPAGLLQIDISLSRKRRAATFRDTPPNRVGQKRRGGNISSISRKQTSWRQQLLEHVWSFGGLFSHCIFISSSSLFAFLYPTLLQCDQEASERTKTRTQQARRRILRTYRVSQCDLTKREVSRLKSLLYCVMINGRLHDMLHASECRFSDKDKFLPSFVGRGSPGHLSY